VSVVDWFVRSPAEAVVSLAPAVLELRGYKGDAFEVRFGFHYKSGAAVPLEGTWRAQIRADPLDDDVLETFDVDVSQQSVGVVTLRLTPAQTVALPQRAVWDLEQTPTGGAVRTWFAGSLYLGGEVTR
jgi:hypothetical protein